MRPRKPPGVKLGKVGLQQIRRDHQEHAKHTAWKAGPKQTKEGGRELGEGWPARKLEASPAAIHYTRMGAWLFWNYLTAACYQLRSSSTAQSHISACLPCRTR
eukprot:380594-Pelagomonas_calceolata.AAC.3